MSSMPLVSVGIPTYNRPAGLRRTLEQITAQTYPHLEIIVSDNCSPDPEVAQVAQTFADQDKRIRYVRQPENFGAVNNFKFVLAQASGDYFMWAADDDERTPLFVQVCLEHMGENGSAMSHRVTLFRETGVANAFDPPALDIHKSPYENAMAFLNHMDPCMFYGLHRRSTVMSVLSEKMFDFFDCFFVFRQILNHGYVIAPGNHFVAGVDGNAYVLKPYAPEAGRTFEYIPFFNSCVLASIRSRRVRFSEKVMLLRQLTKLTIGLFLSYEKNVPPLQVKLARLVSRYS
jgi:glycosyltransferase involved in cell wall biosynthesis